MRRLPRAAGRLIRRRCARAVGAADSDKMKKAPFAYFDEIRKVGVSTVWGEPANLAAALPAGSKFDVVVDNNGKDMEACGPVIDYAKAAGCSQFLFVSSCGVYKVTDEPPHVEGDAVKADAGHVLVEAALKSSGMAWASFRPQYLTGVCLRYKAACNRSRSSQKPARRRLRQQQGL